METWGKCTQLPVPQPHPLIPHVIFCTSKEMGFAVKLLVVCICNLLNYVQFLIFCLFKSLQVVLVINTVSLKVQFMSIMRACIYISLYNRESVCLRPV